MRRGRRRGLPRGFTLTELMIVVAIIGVLTTLAFAYMKPRVTPLDVANRVGNMVREASRRAVALGPVRSDVAIALGSKARTRITSTGGLQPTFSMQYLVENALPSNGGSWVTALTYTVYRDVEAESWGSGVGSHAAVVTSTNLAGFTMSCYPTGGCDSRSVFFRAPSAPTREKYARLSIMPLGAAIFTVSDWN